MAVIGGDFTEITFNHPTLGSGIIFPKAAEDSTLDLGGFTENDDANMVDGGGNMISQLNRKRWSFEGTVAWDITDKKTLEKINSLCDSPVQAEWTFSHISGKVYGATGKPVGDIQGNGNTGTFKLKVSGGGLMKQI